MAKLNRTVSRLIATTVVFSVAAAFCLYMAWTGQATARPLWAVIAALVGVLGAMMFERYRGRRTRL